MSDLILALDGGGTKTELAFANRDGDIVSLISGKSTNPMDSADWRNQLETLFRMAADLLPRTCVAVLGLPGYGEVKLLDELSAAVAADLFPGRRRLMNDVEMALDGALLGTAGILVLAGTGSMAMARGQGGEIVRVGGWGDAFGDEGSAYWIGREALVRTSQALDGRADLDGFATGILDGLGLDASDRYDRLMGWCYGLSNRRSGIAAVAALVDRLGESGDGTALSILRRAAECLSLHMAAITSRLDKVGLLPWSYAGHVFDSRTIRKTLAARHGEPAVPCLDPIGGGLWRAAHEAGWDVDDPWTCRLAESLRQRRSSLFPGQTT